MKKKREQIKLITHSLIVRDGEGRERKRERDVVVGIPFHNLQTAIV